MGGGGNNRPGYRELGALPVLFWVRRPGQRPFSAKPHDTSDPDGRQPRHTHTPIPALLARNEDACIDTVYDVLALYLGACTAFIDAVAAAPTSPPAARMLSSRL
jgi:hypothetical protein